MASPRRQSFLARPQPMAHGPHADPILGVDLHAQLDDGPVLDGPPPPGPLGDDLELRPLVTDGVSPGAAWTPRGSPPGNVACLANSTSRERCERYCPAWFRVCARAWARQEKRWKPRSLASLAAAWNTPKSLAYSRERFFFDPSHRSRLVSALTSYFRCGGRFATPTH